MKKYQGVIIEESLEDTSVLQDVKILSTKVEKVTEKHKTPWLKQWTLHTVEIEPNQASFIADKLKGSLEKKHPWYADYDNGIDHYIIYQNKFFHVDMKSKEGYDAAKDYGISLGIPPHQVDFHPLVEKWKR